MCPNLNTSAPGDALTDLADAAVMPGSRPSPRLSLAAPVSDSGRVRLIDMLRGIAVLGILLINIQLFGLPDYFSESFKNDPGDGNFWLLHFTTVLFGGKMRALFGILFGAGVVLFVRNKEALGRPVRGLFYRRMFWLLLFGLFDAHVILWMGDILYLYAVCGMVVYLFRNAKPGWLITAVPLVAILDFAGSVWLHQDLRRARLEYVESAVALDRGAVLSSAQTDALARWRAVEKTLIPNREDVKENTRIMKSGYPEVASHVRRLAFEFQTKLLPVDMSDSLALMLFGVALLKLGFLTGDWRRESYWKVALAGYAVGLPLVIFSTHYLTTHFPTLEAQLLELETVPVPWVNLIYPFQRILLSMAHIAVLVLVYKSQKFQGLLYRFTCVGQMAFTNYLMQSIICTLFFFGYGLNYFAELEYYQVYFFVLGVWAVQLTYSPWWLKRFLFGPLEWVWRSLTYWRLQPLRRVTQSPSTAAP